MNSDQHNNAHNNPYRMKNKYSNWKRNASSYPRDQKASVHPHHSVTGNSLQFQNGVIPLPSPSEYHTPNTKQLPAKKTTPTDDIEAGVVQFWPLYAPNPTEPPSEGIILIIRALVTSYGSLYAPTGKLLCYELFDPRHVGTVGAANLDYVAMLKHSPIEDLSDALHRTPQSVLCCFALSIHIFLRRRNVPLVGSKIYVHVLKYGPLIPVKNVKSNVESKFVTVKGTVTRVGSVRPLIQSMEFQCDACGAVQQAYFQNGEFEPPKSCLGRCRNRMLNPNVSRATAVDWQLFRLQVRLQSGIH